MDNVIFLVVEYFYIDCKLFILYLELLEKIFLVEVKVNYTTNRNNLI